MPSAHAHSRRGMSSFSSANKKASLLASASVLALLAQAPTAVNAHMRIQEPAPLRGQNNKFYDWSSFDYSMTNPLLPDGSNYPCKGYQTDVPSKSSATDTLKAGQQYTVTLGGDTLHKGGSCQFSLSYDGGKTFGVLHSVIGGCPIAKSYTFPIPSATPAGKNVFLAWSWFNHEGNREMYMGCSAINVESSATAPLKLPAIFQANIFGSECTTIEGQDFVFPNPGDSVEYGGPYVGKKPDPSETSLNNCPGGDRTDGVFVTLVSNTDASSGEASPEPEKPKPDSESESGSEDDQSSESESAPEPTPVESSPSTATKVKLTTSRSKAASSEKATSTLLGQAAEPTQAPLQPNPSPVDTETEDESQDEEGQNENTANEDTQDEDTADEANQDEDTQDADTQEGDDQDDASQDEEINEPACETNKVGEACTGSGIECSEDGQSFYTCSNGAWVCMGDVAAGTICKNGQISLISVTGADESAVACSPNALKCSDDGGSFSVCNAAGNGYINMGIVAPGTICKNGQIGFADKRVKRNNANNTRSAHHHRRQRRGGQPLRMGSH